MSNLNMTIAKTHEFSNRVVGMQLTAGNFVAIALSATQMTLGFIYLVKPTGFGGYALISVIGVALAILIERLTLGGLIAIRISNESVFGLEERHFETLQEQNREETERERQALDRRIKKLKSDRKASIPVTGVGMLLSTVIGDLFWHTIFEPLGNPWLIYPLSFACAGVIGLTFVYSELYKTIMDGSLEEIIQDSKLKETTVAHAGKDMQLTVMADSYQALAKDKEKRAPAQTIIDETLIGRLTNFAKGIEQSSEQNPPTAELPAPGQTKAGPSLRDVRTQVTMLANAGAQKRLPAPHPEQSTSLRGKYEANKAELRTMILKNPNMSNQSIADHFQIAKSTANNWLTKLDAEFQGTNR